MTGGLELKESMKGNEATDVLGLRKCLITGLVLELLPGPWTPARVADGGGGGAVRSACPVVVLRRDEREGVGSYESSEQVL